MECLKLDSKNHRVFLTKIPIPKVEQENEVVIRMAFSGVCGTDLHIIEVNLFIFHFIFVCLKVKLSFYLKYGY